MTAAPGGGSWSSSVETALQWAQAAVSLRGSGPITVAELCVGTLLAHPDGQGEMRQLLDHFELTLRDVLPDDFPLVTVDGLRAAAAKVTAAQSPTWDGEVGDILSLATSLAGGRTRLPHLLGALLAGSTPVRRALQFGLDRFGYDVQQLADEYLTNLPRLDLSGPDPAGVQIGKWLDERFPPVHASLAPFANDAVDATSDFVSVGVEADAFAYLIASKALVPPLAIGLFGNWGSGKSFLMAKIRTRIGQLTELARGEGAGEAQVWGNVAHIEFNAWQYVETNLWAALLDRIFAALSPQALERLSERQRAQAQAELDEQQRELCEKKGLVQELADAESEQAAGERNAAQVVRARQEEAARLRDTLIAAKLEGDAKAQFLQVFTTASRRFLGDETAAVIDETGRLAAAATASPWHRTAFWTRRRIVYVTAAAVLVPVLAYVVERWLSSALAGLLAGLAAVAPLLAAFMRAGADFAEHQRDQLAKAVEQVDAALTQGVRHARQALDDAQTTLATTRQELGAAQREAAAAQAEVERLTKRRDEATAASRLSDFVRDKGESTDYRRLLTEVTMVSRDLKDLTDLTHDYNKQPVHDPKGPPNRIVLYIDDLDRCPPDRVVDVLEAVHLLLSFQLFVVVVAVDTRWLTSSLHEGLPALTDSRGSTADAPTAVDYLEKIFQIPFWVDPLTEHARQRLLRGLLLRSLLEPEVVPGGQDGHTTLTVGDREAEAVHEMLGKYGALLDPQARRLSITADELRFIESLATLIGDTPRRVKRFVNVCHLLLSMAPPLSGDGQQPSERMAACLMAAIHENLPLLAEHIGRRAGAPNSTVATLGDALSGPNPAAEADVRRLKSWLEKHNTTLPDGAPPLENAPLTRLTTRWDMIRRLRFEADTEATLGSRSRKGAPPIPEGLPDILGRHTGDSGARAAAQKKLVVESHPLPGPSCPAGVRGITRAAHRAWWTGFACATGGVGMPLKNYGVLAGRVVNARREGGHDTPHYQIEVDAAGVRFRVAVNVLSQLAPSELLFLADEDFDHPVLLTLPALADGFTDIARTPGGAALDYIRANLFDKDEMHPVPATAPGPDNDLADKLDHYVQRAITDPHARIYAFGERWGPENGKPDKVFGFAPGNGVHDIHMNQGNSGQFVADDGVWQDGGLVLHFPDQSQWVGVFLAFQSQAWHTDDVTGHSLEVPASRDRIMQIIGALINPVGPAPEDETVTLLNAGPQAIDISGWALLDRLKNRMSLPAQSVPGGETIRIVVQPPTQLGNGGGLITLVDPAGAKVDGVSYTKEQASKEGWTIAF